MLHLPECLILIKGLSEALIHAFNLLHALSGPGIKGLTLPNLHYRHLPFIMLADSEIKC